MVAIDYSTARPTIQVLTNAGITDVGRYLADEGDGREIEQGEYQAYIAAGIRVWFVREGAATGMRGGYAKGVSDANVAINNLNRIGAPADTLVYAAADWDVQESEFAVCDAYMNGFASILGLSRVGIYAGMYYINHVRANGLASAYWHAAATDWDHGETGDADITQTTGTSPIPDTDLDIIHNQTPTLADGDTMFMFTYKGWGGIAVPTGNPTKPLHALVLGAQDKMTGIPRVDYEWPNAYAQLYEALDNATNCPAP